MIAKIEIEHLTRSEGPIVYYVPGGGWGSGGRGVQFSKRLDFGRLILKRLKMLGGSKY